MGTLETKPATPKHSVKIKMFIYTFILFMIFIIGFEFFAYYALKDYHYSNLKNLMYSQASYSTQMYKNYVGDYTLSDNILYERLGFTSNLDGQVQIIDKDSTVIYDNSASSYVGTKVNSEDVKAALAGNSSSGIGDLKGSSDKVLSVSLPLYSKSGQVGVLRTTASLSQTNKDIWKQYFIFIIFGCISAILGAFIVYYLSRGIFKPINKLTELAKKYSDGQYEVKSNINTQDEIGELARTMDKMSENIIEKEALKTEFISSVSHELRTPLTSIKGWSITLQDEGLEEDLIKEGLLIIEKESDRLSDMVEDLLDFSRFTSPKFKLTKTTFDIVDSIKTITTQLRPRVKDKEISLIFNYNLPEIEIVADSNRIKQVFINLLDNAIKFTPKEGTVVVNIEDLGDEIKCEVIDTGIGISEEEIDKVTLKFYKGTSSESHTGLGLSICEEIVQAHGGELTIRSVEGSGTNVSFIIPKKVTE